MQTPFQNNSIFFVDVNKIQPNPFQPRLEFDNAQLESLSESIRMYGILQPLVVTRKEVFTEEGGMTAQYELIAGERRLRASKLAGLKEVPVVIRSAEQTDQEKLELAIIENLQREDLNPVDRAKAFRLLADDFKLKHAEIGKRVGKSREYVSNSLRLLALPEEILAALTVKKISEGHARSLLMVGDRPEEQMTLFKEIMLKGLTVRHAEKIARRVAYDKVRKKSRVIDPHVIEVEEEMSEVLGTRVHIERKAVGGKIEIDFFSEDDLVKILEVLKQHESDLVQGGKDPQSKMHTFIEQSGGLAAATGMIFEKKQAEAQAQETTVDREVEAHVATESEKTNPQEEVLIQEEVKKEARVEDVEEEVFLEVKETPAENEKPAESEVVSEEKNVPVEALDEEKDKEPKSTFSYSEISGRKDVDAEKEPTKVAPQEGLEEQPKPTFSYSEVMNRTEESKPVDESTPEIAEEKSQEESFEYNADVTTKNQAEEETSRVNPIQSVQEPIENTPIVLVEQKEDSTQESFVGDQALPQDQSVQPSSQEISIQSAASAVSPQKQEEEVLNQEVPVQNIGQDTQQAPDSFIEKPIQQSYQEERQHLAEEGIEILSDNVSRAESVIPEENPHPQASGQGVDEVQLPQAELDPQEYNVAQNQISESKVNPESIQVQSIVQNAQNPLPNGQSVQNMAETHAEKHADELYYSLPPDAQKTKLDSPTEVATPHYGNAQGNDDHLYRM